MSRYDRAQTYAQTKLLCEADTKLRAAIEESICGQCVVMEGENIDVPTPRYTSPAQIIVSPKRTFEAVRQYRNKKVCVLNFASAVNPGGGVEKGSSAQEEVLCRCSTLTPCLLSSDANNRFYGPHRAYKNPIHNDDCIYTPHVYVIRDDTTEQLLPEEEWYSVDVISCAAPNLRNGIPCTTEELKMLLENRIERIMTLAAQHEIEVLILGAFGCGVFRCPPELVAEVMRSVAEKYRYHFRAIEFAVYCRTEDNSNYKVFRDVFVGRPNA